MNTPIAHTDPADDYERLRVGFLDTLAELAPEALGTPVPATPAWSVHDVLAHVVGLSADLNAQRLPAEDDPAGDRWGANQVESRRSLPLAELRAEWDREAPVFEDGLRLFGVETGAHFMADLHAHIVDVHEALGLPELHDVDAELHSLDHYLLYGDLQLTALGRGAIEVHAGPLRRVVGPEPVVATLTTTPLQVVRVVSARRSPSQIRALDWTGDVDAAIGLLRDAFVGPYSLPSD